MWPFSDSKIAEREFERVVIRVPHPFGDQIIATAALRALRVRYPNAHIALHGNRVAEHIYRGSTFFDEFIVSDKHERFGVQARKLKERNFEAAILFSGSFRSAIPPWLARIPHRIGYRRSGRTALLTAHRKRPQPGPGGSPAPYPTKQFYADLVAFVGAKATGPVELTLNHEDDAYIDAWMEGVGIEKGEPIVALCVGAAYGPSKLWPQQHFAAVADHMVEKHGARPVVLCAPGEEEIGKNVERHAKHPLINTGGAPLHAGGVKSLIARSRVLLTNDTGPRHVAAALGVPSVCLIGPMPSLYTDTDLDTQTVLQEPVPCHPCEKKVCEVEGHPCLANLLPSRAIDAIERVWETR